MKRAGEPQTVDTPGCRAGMRRISIDVSEEVFRELELRPAGPAQVVRAWTTERARVERAKRLAARAALSESLLERGLAEDR